MNLHNYNIGHTQLLFMGSVPRINCLLITIYIDIYKQLFINNNN